MSFLGLLLGMSSLLLAEESWKDTRSKKIIILRNDATLYTSKKNDPKISWKGVHNDFIAFRMTGQKQGWDILENIHLDGDISIQQDFLDTLYLYTNYNLHMLSKEESRVPVLNKAYMYKENDFETWVLPGVPVFQEDGVWYFSLGKIQSLHSSQELILPEYIEVPASHVGTYFEVQTLDRYLSLQEHRYCPDGFRGLMKKNEECAVGRMGEYTFEIAYRIRKQKDKIIGLIQVHPWLFQEVEMAERSFAAEVPHLLGIIGAKGLHHSAEEKKGHNIPKGTTVYWKNEDTAGTLRKSKYFSPSELKQDGERYCVQEFCYKSKDVVFVHDDTSEEK